MSIGILYESDEWSVRHFDGLLNRAGISTELINLETDHISIEQMLRHRFIVNRLFPSAPLRGYETAFRAAGRVLELIRDREIPMINPFEAYLFDCSKQLSAKAMKGAGIPVPMDYICFTGSENLDNQKVVFPCVIKPDCSGRSLYTSIIWDKSELAEVLQRIPNHPFIIQQYIEPAKGYTTRVEIVGTEVMGVMKRYVGADDLSSYHAGSVFEDYTDCSPSIIDASFKALEALSIEMGSLDIIESKDDSFYVIDVNATSNFSEDNVEMFGFDPLRVMAEYIEKQYLDIVSN